MRLCRSFLLAAALLLPLTSTAGLILPKIDWLDHILTPHFPANYLAPVSRPRFPVQTSRGLWAALHDRNLDLSRTVLSFDSATDALFADPLAVDSALGSKIFLQVLQGPRANQQQIINAVTGIRLLPAKSLPEDTGSLVLDLIRRDNSSDLNATIGALVHLPVSYLPPDTGNTLFGLMNKAVTQTGGGWSDIYAAGLAELPEARLPPDIGTELLKELHPNDRDLCGAAITVLIHLPPGRTPSGLSQTLRDAAFDDSMTEECRSFAIAGLSRVPQAYQLGNIGTILLDAVGNADLPTTLRGAAAVALSGLPEVEIPGNAGQVMFGMISDQNTGDKLRSWVADAVRQLPSAKWPQNAVRLLQGIISDSHKDSTIGNVALRILAGLPASRRPPIVDQALAQAMADHELDRNIRVTAMELLCSAEKPIFSDQSGTALLDIVSTAPDSISRAAGIACVGQLPSRLRPIGLADVLWNWLFFSDDRSASAAIDVLARLSDSDQIQQIGTKLIAILRDHDATSETRAPAAKALSTLPPSLWPQENRDASLDYIADQRRPWDEAILRLIGGSSGAQAASQILETGADFPRDLDYWRMLAHVAGGGSADAEELLSLLATQPEHPPVIVATLKNRPDRAASVLAFLLSYWPSNAQLQAEAANRVHDIVVEACGDRPAGQPGWETSIWETVLQSLPIGALPRPCWTSQQRATVATILQRLPPGAAHDELDHHLNADSVLPWVAMLLNSGVFMGILITTLWTLLLLRFPTSRRVQALFLFQPTARAALSAGMFPLMLALIPGLRRWLLRPFRERFLAAAQLHQFNERDWFPGSQLRDKRAQKLFGIREALQKLDRFVVVEGEPGLGKTMLLRWLALRHAGPLAFVHARDCEKGVLAAISAMIHEFAGGNGADLERHGPLRELIFTRDLALVIDGLNEVSVTTRTQIVEFCREMPRAAIAIATQPLDWVPPDTAQWLELQPLDRGQIEQFLNHLADVLPAERPVRGDDFQRVAAGWLIDQLEHTKTAEELAFAQLLLSNPFDLTFAADLLSRGQQPQPGALIGQAYDLAKELYERRHKRDFPEARFTALAYERRLADRNDIEEDECHDEVGPLTEYRLLRRWEDLREGKPHAEWRFRHDRVMNFFLYCHFEQRAGTLAANERLSRIEEMLETHEGDPRFRGVYLLIAQNAPPDLANWVRELVLDRAVARQDHSLLDAFVRLYAARKSMTETRPDSQRSAALV